MTLSAAQSLNGIRAVAARCVCAQWACIELSEIETWNLCCFVDCGTTTIPRHINFSVFGNLSLHRRSHTHTRRNRCEPRNAKRIHAQELCVVHTRHTYDMCAHRCLPQKPFEIANSSIFISFAWARCHRCRILHTPSSGAMAGSANGKMFLRNNFPFAGLEWRWLRSLDAKVKQQVHYSFEWNYIFIRRKYVCPEFAISSRVASAVIK